MATADRELRTVFDADNHYWETSDAFTRFRDPAFADRGLQVQEVDGVSRYVIGGNVSGLSMTWDLIAAGGALTLFTTEGLPFDGSITSIPFSYGTVLAGAAQFNVYLNVDGTNVLVALGEDRTLTAVPEPASITLAGVAALTAGVIVLARRRKSRVMFKQQ